MRWFASIAWMATLLVHDGALAAGGGVSSGGARAAALANATTALLGGGESVGVNPASMSAVEEVELSLSAHAARLDMRFARDGEAAERLGRDVAGITVGLATPAPGVLDVRLGAAVYLPAGRLLRIRAPERIDAPTAPLYGDRLDHVSATFGAALGLGEWGGVGMGVTLAPDLEAPTVVRYEPGRGETPDDNVVLHIDRELNLKASLLLGARLTPAPGWAVGAAWRNPVTSRAFGRQDTEAGSLAVRDDIDFFEFFSPEEIALGLQAPLPAWLGGGFLSADGVWARWSAYRTIHNEPPPRRFADVLQLRAGGEWVIGGLWLRVGYGHEPTPVPEQSDDTNFLDADRHVLAGGVGVRPADGVTVDLHMRTHVLAEQRVDKTRSGARTADLGYPGYIAQGAWWDAGITVTLR